MKATTTLHKSFSKPALGGLGGVTLGMQRLHVCRRNFSVLQSHENISFSRIMREMFFIFFIRLKFDDYGYK